MNNLAKIIFDNSRYIHDNSRSPKAKKNLTGH